MIRRPRLNNQIRVPELRVIDSEGKNLGVLKTEDALKMARESNLDLIEIAPAANPPVAKVMEYGKFLYQEKRRDKEGRKGQKSETKIIRFSVRTTGSDLAFRASQVDKFLQKRYKVRIQMVLRGREKSLRDFANKRLGSFLSLITESYKMEQEPKNFPMGIMMIINKK
ncbi:MAG: translation initiation factor IF-3 [Candidatus Spechtbacterales bacterium]